MKTINLEMSIENAFDTFSGAYALLNTTLNVYKQINCESLRLN
ncbi:hypothetical protein [Paraglaciecola sp.]